MKPTPAQIILAYLGLALLLLGVFHKPVGLSDAIGNTLVFAGIGCNLLCVYLYRRQKARVDAGASGERSQPSRKIVWLSFTLVMLTSLSSFLWLPYTGVAVSRAQLVMISGTTVVLSMIAFFIAFRRGQWSNQSLEPTAGRRDEQV